VVLIRVKENIEKFSLQPQDKVLLAISGGVDSMVLVDVFRRLNLNIGIAHCNFSLRGEESDKDEELVIAYAKRHNTPIHHIRFDTKKEANRLKLSTQLTARKLRYNWFSEIKEKHNYTYLATAHHLDDQLETFIFNLSRGTGISGLRAMLPLNNGLIRPLLNVSKDEVYAYAKKESINWREDKSNTKDKYSRNYIRHQITPKLKELNPNLLNTFNTTISRLLATENIYKKAIQKDISKLFDGNQISILELGKHIEPLQLLYEILKLYHFSYADCQAIYSKLSEPKGQLFYSKSHQVNIDRTHLYLSKKTIKQDWEIPLNLSEEKTNLPNGKMIHVTKIDRPNSFKTEKNTLYLSLENTNINVRIWKEGDKIKPFGMHGQQKKVSDILIDAKVPQTYKKDVLVLLSNCEIIWVVGHCSSESVRITDRKISVNCIKLV